MIASPGSKAFQRPSPVLLSSQCPVVLGSQASPVMSELSYPYRKAVLIDEIRFDLWVNSASAINLGAFVYAKFQLGQHYLMRDFVPIWLLGTTMTEQEEEWNDALVETAQAFSHYRWRLPEPLYVEAGQVLRPVFQNVQDAFSPAADITVQVSYAGRVVPPKDKLPSTIIVPYVAPFVTTLGQTYQQSNEFNLFNPFDQALLIQRLTGRVRFEALGARSFTPAPGDTGMTVQVFDSWGGKMVNDLTGPSDVFDELRAAWTVDTVMPAKGQYDFRVWNIPGSTQAHFAMIGSREERL